MLALTRRLALILILATPGCGMEARETSRSAGIAYEATPPPMGAPGADMAVPRESMDRGVMEAPPSTPTAFAGEAVGAFAGEATPLPRKIIYNAEVSLVVENFEQTEAEIARLVQTSGGYIAEQSVAGSPGSNRSARWRVRVPVGTFEAFLRDLVGLGELERNERTSQDVSEEFYDIAARIKNKQVEEERLIEILQETTGKLEEVLKVEAELSRVRGEIESMQGRLRVLTDLTSLTTVTIQVREREKFEPPPPVAPDFATQVTRTFDSSKKELRELGEAVALFAVDWVLWLPVVLLVVLVAWGVIKLFLRGFFRLIRRAWAAARPAPAPMPPPAT